MLDLLAPSELTSLEKVGRNFIVGYGAGFGIGTIAGLARNFNELPLVRLNGALNTSIRFGERLGYQCAMVSTVYALTQIGATRLELHPPAAFALTGGAVGAFCGTRWGVKGTCAGGVVGAAIGAAWGIRQEYGTFDQFLKRNPKP
jgi:hypothetical protein